MARFLVRRLFSIFISIIGATLVIFILTRLGPDPIDLYLGDSQVEVTEEFIEMLRAELGLDKSLPEQYGIWVWNIAQLDMGYSIGTQRLVKDIIAIHIGTTLKLAAGAWIFAVSVGVSVGVLAAVKRATVWDYIGRIFALFGQATPQFWTGVMAILIFAVILGWFPAGTLGRQEGNFFLWKNLQHWILPWIVLGWPAAAGIMRLTRSSMLEILDSEYIKLGRAKGVSPQKIIWKHAFRNALIQPLTASTLILTGFLTGAVLVETIFAWPGMGDAAIRAVNNNDFPLLQGFVFFFTILFVFSTFIIPLLIYVVGLFA